MAKTISAKLLLAGEFTVLIGGDTIGIPFFRFFGEWIQTEENDSRLHSLYIFLLNSKIDFLNLESFRKDIANGWRFKSNIPEGYGLGSSGALSAAILIKYGYDTNDSLEVIQKRLAAIESFYHGTSSGFDPLISYSSNPCILRDRKSFILPNINLIENKLKSNLYLIDSNTERNSILPIDWFYQQLKQDEFKNVSLTLNALNDQLIQTLTDEIADQPASYFKNISKLQYDYFQPLIVDSIKDFWSEGILNNTHYCKLCGKGGGGYYFVWLNIPILDFQDSYPDKSLVQIF